MRASLTLLAGALAVMVPISPGHAGTPAESVIHIFDNTARGVRPAAGMIMDAAGDLFGMLYTGETGVNGGVFELTPKADGRGWTERTLHRFGPDRGGKYPTSTVLTMGASGNLYGTTPQGGTNDAGVAFELIKPAGDGAWQEKVLYHFNGGRNGGTPYCGMVFGPGGNLYGTTGFGGAAGAGTVFMLSPDATKATGWAETVLYSFTNGADGGYPYSLPVFDAAGNLYGTAENGGTTANGVVFELSPPSAGGAWTETVLHSFGTGSDGATPRIALILDQAGNLYGTTNAGGAYNAGVVYELSPPATGESAWTEVTLHDFDFNPQGGVDGGDPSLSTLVFDKQGALYGTARVGGTGKNGIAFQLTPPAGGGAPWQETILHSFAGAPDGAQPEAGVVMGADGTLYGTTFGGGNAAGYGTVYKLEP
jgi:uncharacterized repeat protein (TIGR03803 family)